MTLPIPVAARSKEWVCGRSPAGIAEHRCLSLLSVVCRQIGVSTTGRSLVQRNPAECCVSECDREASIMRRHWSIMGCCAIERKYITLNEVMVSSLPVLLDSLFNLFRQYCVILTS